MELQYVYQKKRSEFGKQCMFSDRGPELIDNYASNAHHLRKYIFRDPVDHGVQVSCTQAEHEFNTIRAEYTTGAMNHVEGGWPRDVNTADEEQTKRYRRKIEKDEGYWHTMQQLMKSMENCILQNNAINIYQQYYTDVEPTLLIEPSSARTVNVFCDQCVVVRPITHMSWSPDGGNKLVVSHCNMNFQVNIPDLQSHSYIWEIENPNTPLLTLDPPSQSVCLEYHQKDSNLLVSGQINGLVAVWDIRHGCEPVNISITENSHRDPVHSILWIHSKTGTEFFSSSTDGQVMWWDNRKLTEPLETLMLDPVKLEDQAMSNAFGASCLEYEYTIPTRFMVGTEQGSVISCNRKGKTPIEKMGSKFSAHFGPVLALQRNPAFVKNFMTVGDWTVRIWSEDCKESSIMWTSFHKAMLTDGAWSPTRYSVFFTTRSDGILDVWDILQNQQSASIGVKVCDERLCTLRTHDAGRLVGVGNKKGSTYIVEFSENLSSSNKTDKALLTAMFEREGKRERTLETRNKELKLKLATKRASQMPPAADPDAIDRETSEIAFVDKSVIQAEADFYLVIENETKPPEIEVPIEEEVEVVDLPEDVEEEPPPPPPKIDAEPEKKDAKKGKKKK